MSYNVDKEPFIQLIQQSLTGDSARPKMALPSSASSLSRLCSPRASDSIKAFNININITLAYPDVLINNTAMIHCRFDISQVTPAKNCKVCPFRTISFLDAESMFQT